MTVIKDGEGQGVFAGVTNENRLKVAAESINVGTVAALDGFSFLIGTPDVELTSNNQSTVLYIDYEGTRQLIISEIYVTVGKSSGASDGDPVDVDVEKRVTGGTIVSSGTDVPTINTRFNSARILDGVFKSGAEGLTATGGTAMGTFRLKTGSLYNRIDFGSDPFVLDRGAVGAITITPPAGNTSMTVRAAVLAFEYSEDT